MWKFAESYEIHEISENLRKMLKVAGNIISCEKWQKLRYRNYRRRLIFRSYQSPDQIYTKLNKNWTKNEPV